MNANKRLEEYRQKLQQYNAMIDQDQWWDGRQQRLADEMAKLVDKMSDVEKQMVMQMQNQLYHKRIF